MCNVQNNKSHDGGENYFGHYMIVYLYMTKNLLFLGAFIENFRKGEKKLGRG